MITSEREEINKHPDKRPTTQAEGYASILEFVTLRKVYRMQCFNSKALSRIGSVLLNFCYCGSCFVVNIYCLFVLLPLICISP